MRIAQRPGPDPWPTQRGGLRAGSRQRSGATGVLQQSYRRLVRGQGALVMKCVLFVVDYSFGGTALTADHSSSPLSVSNTLTMKI